MSSVFEQATGLHLLAPGFLLLTLLVPVVLWLRHRSAREAVVDFAPAAMLPATSSWRTALRGLPSGLYGLGLVCVAVALARPAERSSLPVTNDGIDILLLLDTSSSMKANDMDRDRSRLEVARDAAIRFVDGRPDDRIGLIAFARYADVRCPLTLDHRALVRYLTDLETTPSDGAEDATGIGTSVARAADVLRGSAALSKVVILLTDGEENVALEGKPGEIPPAHAAQLCERLGIKVYVVVAGVGRRTPSGSVRPPDTRAVEDVAARTGGTFHAARDADAVAAVYDHVDALEKTSVEEPHFVFEDRYLALLVVAFLLLLAGAFLASTVLEVLP